MRKIYHTLYKVFYIILLSSCTAAAIENAKPLGFELGKTTFDEFKARYYHRHIEIGFSDYTKGFAYRVPTELLPLENVEKVRFFFNHKNKMVLIGMDFEAWRFNSLKKMLSEKYQLIREEGMNVPILGNVGKQLAKYIQGNIKITLSMESKSSYCGLTYEMIKDPDQENSLITSEKKELL